jgi:AcrR family transcriptional regulator
MLHTGSARRQELLEKAYRYVLVNGLADVSLRPLAAAIGSSPRVLLLLFGSKDGLIRVLLARSRVDQLALLDRIRQLPRTNNLGGAVATVWEWLAAPDHRPLLALWLEAYTRSVVEPDGAWAGFARQTVDDWLAALTDLNGASDPVDRTLALAVLRGALLDLLATGDRARVTRSVRRFSQL